MHFITHLPRTLTLGLAASVFLSAHPARAQTQDLFVTNQSNNTVTRFAGTGPGTFATTGTTLMDLSLNKPVGIAFDPSGDLIVSNFNGDTITVFAAGPTPGAFGAVTSFTDSLLNGPGGIAVDAHGNLFVPNFSTQSIIAFVPGPTPGTWTRGAYRSGQNLEVPVGLAFDANGTLFATNQGNNTVNEFAASPFLFPPTASGFSDPSFNWPAGLAFDTRGDLFIANQSFSSYYGRGNNIIEFQPGTRPGQFKPGTVFAANLGNPEGLAFDAGGDLFVANSGFGSGTTITEFAYTPGMSGGAGMFAPAQIVETGLSGPAFLAFGPTAPVPAAHNQSVTTAQETAVAVPLSGSDPNSPALPLTYAVITPPAHGALSGTAPNLTYTPSAGYLGPDAFTFTVSNGTETSALATVSITVNAPPVLSSLAFPSPVSGGTVPTATVTLSGVAQTDTVVGLSSSDSSVVRVHRSVIVPAGASSATFPINTYRSHVTQMVTITATLNGVAQTQTLTITGR